MARKSSGPWFWEKRGQYVVNVAGKRHYLGTNEEDAIRQWHELESRRNEPQENALGDDPFIRDILDSFLTWVENNRAKNTLEWYTQRIQEFLTTIPDLKVGQLKKFHVQKWVDTKNSDAHKRGCIIAISRGFNWAVNQDLLDKNPIRGIEKPSPGRREVVIDDETYKAMLGRASDQQFRDLLAFSWETGARPQETFRLEKRHLNLKHARCEFPESESKGKKKRRVIYFNEIALEIVKRLAEQNPEGELFRNADGDPWRRNQVACRFARMKKHLGWKPKLYHLRHTWISRMLKAGNDPITVARMAGHNDPTMLARVYAHVENDPDYLHRALGKLQPKSES